MAQGAAKLIEVKVEGMKKCEKRVTMPARTSIVNAKFNEKNLDFLNKYFVSFTFIQDDFNLQMYYLYVWWYNIKTSVDEKIKDQWR